VGSQGLGWDGMQCDARGRSATHHHFVEDRAGRVGHLVKLVDAAHTAVREHERTAGHRNQQMMSPWNCRQDPRSPLEDQLLAVRVAGHVGGETDCRRTLA
jgi:hypothetical protein